MDKKRIHTNDAPAAVGPYSQAIRVGDHIFTAGQVALDPTSGEQIETPKRRDLEFSSVNGEQIDEEFLIFVFDEAIQPTI
ncbi:MAG: Rid family hydrolase [Chloroflexota bacterium]